MDRKDPLILILVILLFGAAIAGAIWVFTQKNVRVVRDSMFAEITRISADAFQYRRRPATMGGGGGSYLGYSLPERFRSDRLGTYAISETTTADTLVIDAIASKNLGTIRAGVDPEGTVRILRLTGEFAY